MQEIFDKKPDARRFYGVSGQTVDKVPNRQNIVMLSPFVILRNAVTKNLFAIDTARILRFRSG